MLHPPTDLNSSAHLGLTDDLNSPVALSVATDVLAPIQPYSPIGASRDGVQLTFIDTGIENYQQLADHIIAGDVFFIDTAHDGIDQITATLGQYDSITGLHLVTHGSAGQLQMGSSILNSQALAKYEQAFKGWANILTEEADILLYACNVANTAVGRDFVTYLSQLTQADVAASTDLTGHAAQLGDWDLEFATGTIEANTSFAATIAAAYQGVLATYRDVNEIRIMPLGDSITQGNFEFNSYRRPLWQQLNANGYNKVNFVGSQVKNGTDTVPNPDFDLDHESYGGRRADQILENISSWANAARPDVVLLHLGTNDLIQKQSVQSTLDDISNIIDRLRDYNSNIAILLAKVTPSVTKRGGEAIAAFNRLVPDLAQSKNRSGSPVILVDQESGFNVKSNTYDGLHPNASGEIKMANRWFAALDELFKSNHEYQRNGSSTGGSQPAPLGKGNGLKGDYFNNIDFTDFAVSSVDPTVNFLWSSGSPHRSIGVDTFSARWTGQVQARYSEDYTFYTTGDDGVRLWVNGQLIIDGFIDQAPTEYSGKIRLEAGQKYDIKMEYYENGGGALAQLAWSSASQFKQIIPQSQLYSSSNSPEPTPAPTPTPTPIPPVIIENGGSQPVQLGNGNGLKGDYFNNQNFTGFALTRVDSAVNFDWGSGSPHRSIGVDTFSARWTGQVQARYSEDYTFYTTGDDGVRLWVNGQLIIDGFIDQAPTEYSGRIRLEAGQKYDIKMEYYENRGGALAQLAWSSASQFKQIIPQSQLYSSSNSPEPTPAPTPTPTPTPVPPVIIENGGSQPVQLGNGNGLKGDYFNNQNFTGFALTRVDSAINFDWGSGSPHRSIGVDTFSARWTGQVQARYSEDYTFYTTGDDGVRLWVNGQLIIDGFIDQAPTEYSGKIRLEAGQKYDIKMEYYENRGGALAQLSWSSASQFKEIIPQSQLFS